MEYIVVDYEESRDVYVDDQPCGKTGETLRVDRGTHTINMGETSD